MGFEVYRVEGGAPLHALEGWCEEGAILLARQYLREKTRAFRKKWQAEDLLTPLRQKHSAFVNKHNGQYH